MASSASTDYEPPVRFDQNGLRYQLVPVEQATPFTALLSERDRYRDALVRIRELMTGASEPLVIDQINEALGEVVGDDRV